MEALRYVVWVRGAVVEVMGVMLEGSLKTVPLIKKNIF